MVYFIYIQITLNLISQWYDLLKDTVQSQTLSDSYMINNKTCADIIQSLYHVYVTTHYTKKEESQNSSATMDITLDCMMGYYAKRVFGDAIYNYFQDNVQ